jgi:hypothetical protein
MLGLRTSNKQREHYQASQTRIHNTRIMILPWIGLKDGEGRGAVFLPSGPADREAALPVRRKSGRWAKGRRRFFREDGMRAALVRRELGLEGDGDVWRRCSNPSCHASPSFVSHSRWNERGKRRRDGREKHDSGDEFLFPYGSTGNRLRRHGSFLVEGVSKRQRGLVGVPLKALCLVLVISDNAQVLIMCLRLYVAKDN